MTFLADILSTVFERRYRFRSAGNVDNRPLEALIADLIGGAGEVSGVALAQQILNRYGGWTTRGSGPFSTIWPRT
ncbi:hypothetical protein ACFQEX_20265 [Roseibium salinum]|uniref:hypothetical protein n=1 Tax=Roseibium salinum TaxID=1604349 RepID=UPI00361D03FD